MDHNNKILLLRSEGSNITESVDSTSRDGLYTCIIIKSSEHVRFELKLSNFHNHNNLEQPYVSRERMLMVVPVYMQVCLIQSSELF